MKKKTIFVLLIALLVIALAVGAVVFFLGRSTTDGGYDRILISQWPKLVHDVGAEPDYAGLVIQHVKANGESETIVYNAETAKDFTITGFDSKKIKENQKITVVYAGLSTSFEISIREPEKPTPILVGISMGILPKTEYKVGEWLNTDGGTIIREYNDGSTSQTIFTTQDVTDGWEEAWNGGPGTYTLTVSYKENFVLKKTTYQITITE